MTVSYELEDPFGTSREEEMELCTLTFFIITQRISLKTPGSSGASDPLPCEVSLTFSHQPLVIIATMFRRALLYKAQEAGTEM